MDNNYQSIGANLADFAIRKPVTTVMIFLSLLVFGMVSSRLLPLEKFPGIDIPVMVVQVPYADATPAEVEKMITRPMEEALATMSGIQRLQSQSTENFAQVMIQFKWEENLNAKSIEAREKVDAIKHLLPSDVERVLVYQFNTSDMPIFRLRISSERDLSNAYDLLERNLQRPVERVPGVSKVTLYGVQKKQIAIRLNSDRIAALHIDNNLLMRKLRESNFSITAGTFFDVGRKVLVNPIGEYRSLEEIQQIYITQYVQLQDIADVAYETPKREEGRHLDQSYAIGMDIFRESDANLVDVSERVLSVIEKANDNPQFNGISLYVMDDEADSVKSSLMDVLYAGLVGALLSIIVLYMFLRHMTTTLVVVLSVPFSICIALGYMYMFGYSLNVLSLMGLMLAVGMLVDNAVVITESIHQEKAKIKDKVEGTKAGVSKVSLAVIAGTATTAIVFLPNIIGKKIDVTVFLEHVAIAICISLFASLLIAQTLIPLLTTKIKPHVKKNKNSGRRLKAFYERTLNWTLDHPGKTTLIAILVTLSVIIPFKIVQNDEDPDQPNGKIYLKYHIQGSYALEEVEKTVTEMEDYLYSNKDIFYIDSVYSFYTPGYAMSTIQLVDDLPITQADLKKQIAENFPKFANARPSWEWNNGSGGGVRLNLLGHSSEVLMEISNNIVPILKNIDGLEDVGPDMDEQKLELRITVDRNAAFRFDLSTQDIASIVATALRGSNMRTFRHPETGETDVRVMFDEELQHSLDELKNITILRNEDQNVTLDMVAELSITPRLSRINRYFRQTNIAIGGNLGEKEDGEKLTLEEARKQIEGIMQHIELPTGYSWSLDGSFRRQREAQNLMLENMILAVIMIYVVMAALFESLLLPTAVITSLLFSIVGVFWALLVTGTPVSVMAMIGILILMGIVVNNGIVLVDRINQLVNEGFHTKEAIMEACRTRVKPILMTVATTVLGLVPLAAGNTQIGGDGPPYAPMAIAIIGGLVFSTVTSLYLVPWAYVWLLKLRKNTSNLLLRSKYLAGKVIKV